VVGPTPAELESLNELINFDHIYYKPAIPVIPKQESTELEPIIGDTIEIISDDDSQDCEELPSSSDTHVICDTSRVSNESQNLVENVHSSDSSSGLTSDIPLDIEGLLDFSSINWDNMSLDLDALASLTSDATQDISMNICQPPESAVNSTSPEEYLSKPTKLNNVNVNITSDIFTPNDHRLNLGDVTQGLDQHITIKEELGYGSEFSDAGSPMSSVSSHIDDLWEDSFTELFPSLL